MRILFSMHCEAGHHMGTFRLARTLAARGHSVVYLGIPCVKKLVEDQGFEFIEFAGHLFSESGKTGVAPGVNASQNRRAKRSQEETLFRRYTTAIVDGTLDKCLRSAHADLLLCDAFLWYMALRALRLRIPTIQIATSLFLYDNPQIPPAVTAITPRDGFWSGVQVLLAWKRMHLKYLFTKRLASRLVGAFRAPLRMHHLTDTFHWVAKQSDFQAQRNYNYVQDEIGPHLILPELVLCTSSFQFPGKLPKERRYCGDFIDFDRQEACLPMEPADKTIILCSLGTSAGAYPEARQFFSAVAEASRLAPDWFFVLHISDRALIGDFSSTQNLLVVPWAPQLALLRHAAVMVNHGGLNSIMECVQCEVPMVILPCARDQPGNAARAAFHHLGLTAEIKTITGDRLRALITSAMDDPILKTGLKKMKETIERDQGLQGAVDFIEGFCNAQETGHPTELSLDCSLPKPLGH